MPSRTDGFGFTGLEAFSAGIPVIVSKNSGFEEALGSVPIGSSFALTLKIPVHGKKPPSASGRKTERYNFWRLCLSKSSLVKHTVRLNSANILLKRCLNLLIV